MCVCLLVIWGNMFTWLWPWFVLWDFHSHVFLPGLVISLVSFRGWTQVIVLSEMKTDDWVILLSFAISPSPVGLANLVFFSLIITSLLSRPSPSYVTFSLPLCVLGSTQAGLYLLWDLKWKPEPALTPMSRRFLVDSWSLFQRPQPSAFSTNVAHLHTGLCQYETLLLLSLHLVLFPLRWAQ